MKNFLLLMLGGLIGALILFLVAYPVELSDAVDQIIAFYFTNA